MRGKKGLAWILTLAMAVSMTSLPALAADEKKFNDTQGNWAESSITRWTGYGIVGGDENGNFRPAGDLSRGELAKVMSNMFGLKEKAANTYADLKGDEWYADDILKCTAAGIMKGDGTNCNATDKISRQETMVMFGRGVGVKPVANADMSAYTDGGLVAPWAAEYMAPLTKMGILSGVGDNKIAPTTNIDRASTMSLLDKAISSYINVAGDYKIDNAKAFAVVNVPAEGKVNISGSTSGVVVAAGTAASVVANNLTADTVKIDNTAAVSVEGASKLAEVTSNSTGALTIASGVKLDKLTANAASTVTNNGTITTLSANAAVKVENRGTITNADVKADGVVLAGAKPTTITVATGTKNPVDGTGAEIKPVDPVTPPAGGGQGETPVQPTTPESAIAGITAIKSIIPNAPALTKYDLDFAKSGNTFTASGALGYVENWEEFSGLEEQQSGYYVSFSIPLTNEQQASMLKKDAGNIFWLDSNFAAENGTHVGKENVFNDTDTSLIDGEVDNYFINIVRLVKDKAALANANFNFSIDYDGSNNNDFRKTTYSVDLSKVVILPDGADLESMAAGDIAFRGDGAGSNPITKADVASVGYGNSYGEAGIVYENGAVAVDAADLESFLTTNKANGDVLAALMNKHNNKLWVGMKYSAPEGATGVKVSYDKIDGIQDKAILPVNDEASLMDYVDIGTFDLTTGKVTFKNNYMVTYLMWIGAEDAVLGVSKVEIPVTTNLKVSYTVGTATTTETVVYGKELAKVPTEAGYTLSLFTDAAMSVAYTPAAVTTNLELFGKLMSDAKFEAMTNAVYVADYKDWAGHPEKVEMFGEFTFTQEGRKVTVTGTSNYVTGFTGFGSPEQQEGNYLTVQIPVLTTDVPTDATAVIGGKGTPNSPIKVSNLITVEGKQYYTLLITTVDKTAEQLAAYPISIYWNGNESTKTDYVIDFSGVDLTAKPSVTPPVVTPAAAE